MASLHDIAKMNICDAQHEERNSQSDEDRILHRSFVGRTAARQLYCKSPVITFA